MIARASIRSWAFTFLKTFSIWFKSGLRADTENCQLHLWHSWIFYHSETDHDLVKNV